MTAAEPSEGWEAVFVRLEQQFAALQQEHEVTKADRDRLQNANEQLESKIHTVQAEVSASNARAEEARTAAMRMEFSAKRAQEERDSLQASLDMKQQELDRVAEELRIRSQRLQEATDRESHIAAEISAAKAVSRPLQLQVERLSEEKELFLKQKQWFEQELESRQAALLDVRKAAAIEKAGLVSEVEQLRASLSACEANRADISEELERVRAQLRAAESSITEAESNALRVKDALTRQLSVQERLATLHQAAAEEGSRRIAQLEAMLASLGDRAAEEARRGEEEREAAIAACKEAHAQTEASLRAQVEQLGQQLAEARAQSTPKGMLAALQQDPSLGASATVTALELLRAASEKAGAGASDSVPLTATALYARVQVAEETLAAEKHTSAELRACLNQVLTELEAKAPIIQQQQRDYERALASHEELARRLNEALQEAGQTAAALDTERASRREAEEQVLRLRVEVSDLAQQLQTLLRQQLVHGSDGVKTRPHADGPASYAMQSDDDLLTALIKPAASTATEVVAEHLVTYEDIDQLQQRNQQLLRVVRLLARQLAQAGGVLGTSTQASSTGSASEALRQMMAEVAQLRADREKHASMVATLAQQRDMYRVLLQQADSTLLERQELHDVRSPSGDGHADLRPVRRASSSAVGFHSGVDHQALSHMLDEARSEVSRLQSELQSQGKEAERMQLELREEITELKLQVAAAAADSRLHSQRAESLRSAEEAARKEVVHAQHRAQETQNLLAKYEKEAAQRDVVVVTLKEEISGLKSQAAHLQAQREVLEAAEARNMQSLKGALEDRDRYAKLVDSMRTLESTLMAREAAERQQLAEDRARLQKEWMNARQALDDERTLNAQRTQAHANELKEAVRKHDDLLAQLAATRAELSSVQKESDGLKSQLANLNEQVAAAQSRVEGRVIALGARGDVDANRLSAIELQLRTVSAELDNAKELLASKDKHLAEFKAISQAAEESLKTLREASEKWKAEAAENAATTRLEVESLRSQVASLTARLQEENASHLAATSAWFSKEDELRQQISSAQADVKSLETKLAAAGAREQQLLKDITTLEESRRATQHNYDLQLQMHAADSKALTMAQERVKTLEESLRSAREDAAKASAALLTAQQVWSMKEQSMTKQVQDATAQFEDLKHQNAILHSQLQVVASAADAAAQSFAARAEETAASTTDASSTGDDELGKAQKSVKDLREVIAFLRRQNEVFECKAELAEQRATGLHDQVVTLRKELDELRSASSSSAAGSATGSASSSKVLSSAEYEKLLNAVNERNLLRESNETLRHEAASAVNRLESSLQRIDELESKVTPLQTKAEIVEAERDALRDEVKRRNDEISMWRGRLDAVLSRHDTIDPAVHKALQEQVTVLQEQVSRLSVQLQEARTSASAQAAQMTAGAEAQVAELKEKVVALQAAVDRESDRASKMRKAATDNIQKLRAKEKEFNEMQEATSKEIADLKAALEQAQAAPAPTPAPAPAPKAIAQLERLRKELAEAHSSQATAAAQLEACTAEKSHLQQELDAAKANIMSLESQLEAEKAAKSELEASLHATQVQLTATNNKLVTLKGLFVGQRNKILNQQAAQPTPEPAVPAEQSEPATAAPAATEEAVETPTSFLPLRPPSVTPADAAPLTFGEKAALPIPASPARGQPALARPPTPLASLELQAHTEAAPAPATETVADPAALRARALAARAGKSRKAPVATPEPVTSTTDEAKIAQRAARFGIAMQSSVAGSKRKQRPEATESVVEVPATQPEGEEAEPSEAPKAKVARTSPVQQEAPAPAEDEAEASQEEIVQPEPSESDQGAAPVSDDDEEEQKAEDNNAASAEEPEPEADAGDDEDEDEEDDESPEDAEEA